MLDLFTPQVEQTKFHHNFVEITKDIPELSKYDTLRSHSLSILGSNDDIAFIEFIT